MNKPIVPFVVPRPTGFLPGTFRKKYVYGYFLVHGYTDGKREVRK